MQTLQLERRVRRYHALLATYHVLLDDGKRQLNLERWTQLALAVKPAVRSHITSAFPIQFVNTKLIGTWMAITTVVCKLIDAR
jgi:hypothetical protein